MFSKVLHLCSTHCVHGRTWKIPVHPNLEFLYTSSWPNCRPQKIFLNFLYTLGWRTISTSESIHLLLIRLTIYEIKSIQPFEFFTQTQRLASSDSPLAQIYFSIFSGSTSRNLNTMRKIVYMNGMILSDRQMFKILSLLGGPVTFWGSLWTKLTHSKSFLI